MAEHHNGRMTSANGIGGRDIPTKSHSPCGGTTSSRDRISMGITR